MTQDFSFCAGSRLLLLCVMRAASASAPEAPTASPASERSALDECAACGTRFGTRGEAAECVAHARHLRSGEAACLTKFMNDLPAGQAAR